MANVRFRLRDGRDFQLFHKSELAVIPEKWDERQQKIKARCIINELELKTFDTAVNDRKALIHCVYLSKGKMLTSDLLDEEIDKVLHPDKYQPKEQTQTFFEAFNEFLSKRKLSDVRITNYKVVMRALMRYEIYVQTTKWNDFILSFDTVTSLVLQHIEDFLQNEHLFAERYPSIY